MVRDPGLEEVASDELAEMPGVTRKAMFGASSGC